MDKPRDRILHYKGTEVHMPIKEDKPKVTKPIIDIYLTESDVNKIADKFMHYNTPDSAVKETAIAAANHAAKQIIDWLKLNTTHGGLADKPEDDDRVILNADWQALLNLVKEK